MPAPRNPKLLLALVPALCASALLAASAGASAKVRVSDVRADARAHVGGSLAVRATVGGATRKTTARVYLSRDRRRSKDDVAVAGVAKVGTLQKGRGTAALVAKLPAKVKAGGLYALACVKSVCATSRTRTQIAAAADDAKTSGALIAADVKSGRLGAEKALTYRAFAVFGDDRLPARYSGDVTAAEDDGVFREIADRWPKLSAATRKALTTVLAPAPSRKGKPARARSAEKGDGPEINGGCLTDGYKDIEWKSVTAAGGAVRINWEAKHPEYATNVKQIAADVTTAYARYKQVMGRQPLSDFKSSCWHGKDSALDIYLDDELRGADGVTIPVEMRTRYTPDCDRMASLIIARPTSRSFTVRFAIAHELFHAFQNAFVESDGCQPYKWFDEGAANWAAHSAFPTDDSEHYFKRGLTDPETAVDFWDYHSWPFMLWMQKAFGDRSIRTAYEQFEKTDSIHAIDTAIGTFRKSFLDYAKNAWNQTPFASFKDWDRFDAVPMTGGSTTAFPHPYEPQHLFLAGQKQRTASVPARLADRTRSYSLFTITDDKLREITWKNPLAGDPDFRVGLIVTLANGQSRFDDLSGQAQKRYCRDNPNENIASLVVVYANSALGSAAHGEHTIDGTPEIGLRDSCDDPPWHFKVLSAALTTHADGTKTASDDQLCGTLGGLPISGGTTSTAATTGAVFSPDFDVKAGYGGALSGSVFPRAPGKYAYSLQGCRGIDTGDPITSCATAFERPILGDGTKAIGFALEAAGKDATTATLKWAISDPEVGFVDAADDVCNVQSFWHPLTVEQESQQVPLASFTGTAPFTLSFKGTAGWTTDSYGKPATLTYDWEYAMTLQRVDAAGNPLQ